MILRRAISFVANGRTVNRVVEKHQSTKCNINEFAAKSPFTRPLFNSLTVINVAPNCAILFSILNNSLNNSPG